MDKQKSLNEPFKYILHKIADRLYCVEITCSYDLAMLFVRYQEYYESPNPKVRGKKFDLVSYMRWYAKSTHTRYDKDTHKSFSYPIDYCGFNIPSYVIQNILISGEYLGELNMYDYLMGAIYKHICEDMGITEMDDPLNKFYLIGTPKMKSSTMKHEVAHGLYYLNEKYYKTVRTMIRKKLNKDQINNFKGFLSEHHYCKDVMTDEIQAYLSTGKNPVSGISDHCRKQFVNHFQKYYKQMKPKKICENSFYV